MKRKKCKKVIEKYNTIIEIINNNQYITITDISKITGISIATISRILKDNGYNKKDLRKNENKYEAIRSEINNEVSDT
jgi:DeoR/GlpR family transcriptional regulator of sugar metabolism